LFLTKSYYVFVAELQFKYGTNSVWQLQRLSAAQEKRWNNFPG